MGKKKVWRTTWWKWKMETDHLSSILYIGGGAGSKEKKTEMEDRKRNGKTGRWGRKGDIENALCLYFATSPLIC